MSGDYADPVLVAASLERLYKAAERGEFGTGVAAEIVKGVVAVRWRAAWPDDPDLPKRASTGTGIAAAANVDTVHVAYARIRSEWYDAAKFGSDPVGRVAFAGVLDDLWDLLYQN